MKNSTNSVAAASFVTSNNELTDGFDPLVQNVLDLLPGTDTDLIKKCLKYYGQNVEQVINAFLENNLPEFQSDEPEMPNSLEIEENDCVTSKVVQELSELDLRKNIYDGDKFDVFKKDKVDMSSVLLGKKAEIETLDLNRKDHLDREFYKNYDQIMYERECKELGINPESNMIAEYEDEYDDTYDDNTNANDEIEPESFIKPLNQKMDVKKRDQYEVDEEDSENMSTQKMVAGNQSQKPFARQSNDNQQRHPNQTTNNRTYNNQQSKPQNGAQKQQPLPQRVPKHQKNNNQQSKPQNSVQKQQPLPQRVQEHRRPDEGAAMWADKSDVSQHFKEKYGKPGSGEQRHVAAANVEEDLKKVRDEREAKSTEKTAEQIKRERKWKNDNKNKHRKDQASKKTNFF